MEYIYVAIRWEVGNKVNHDQWHYEFPRKLYNSMEDVLKYIKQVVVNTPYIYAGRVVSYQWPYFTDEQKDLIIMNDEENGSEYYIINGEVVERGKAV